MVHAENTNEEDLQQQSASSSPSNSEVCLVQLIVKMLQEGLETSSRRWPGCSPRWTSARRHRMLGTKAAWLNKKESAISWDYGEG
jgi:hypothetical protein